MDQFSSIMGLENKVIKIDCRTLDYTYHDADFANYSLLLFDSNLQHSLFTSEYNNRRIECDEGLSIINDNYPEINSFRDCNDTAKLFEKKNQDNRKPSLTEINQSKLDVTNKNNDPLEKNKNRKILFDAKKQENTHYYNYLISF